MQGHHSSMALVISSSPMTSLRPVPLPVCGHLPPPQLGGACTATTTCGFPPGGQALSISELPPLDMVGIPNPEQRMSGYLHQFSPAACRLARRLMIYLALTATLTSLIGITGLGGGHRAQSFDSCVNPGEELNSTMVSDKRLGVV